MISYNEEKSLDSNQNSIQQLLWFQKCLFWLISPKMFANELDMNGKKKLDRNG